MKTLLINDTTQVIRIIEGNAGVYTFYAQLDPGEKQILTLDPNETYREFNVRVEAQEVQSLSWDDFTECDVVTFHVTPNGSVAWRGAPRDKLKKKEPYKLLESDAAAILKTVASLCASLEIDLKQIKICHAQCELLVQSLSKGIQKNCKDLYQRFPK